MSGPLVLSSRGALVGRAEVEAPYEYPIQGPSASLASLRSGRDDSF